VAVTDAYVLFYAVLRPAAQRSVAGRRILSARQGVSGAKARAVQASRFAHPPATLFQCFR
jgi:hypothetical protein